MKSAWLHPTETVSKVNFNGTHHNKPSACSSDKGILLVLLALQDSDSLWRLSPPARAALSVVLNEPAAALRMSWSIMRTGPLASGKGGPECTADVTVTLAGESRQQLLEVRWACTGYVLSC